MNTTFETREALLAYLATELDMSQVRIVGDTIFYSDGSASAIQRNEFGRFYLVIACSGIPYVC